MMNTPEPHVYTDDELRIADMQSEGGGGAPTRASPPRQLDADAQRMDDDGGRIAERN